MTIHLTWKNLAVFVLGVCLVALAVIPLVVEPENLKYWRIGTLILAGIGIIALILQMVLQSKDDGDLAQQRREQNERERQLNASLADLTEAMKRTDLRSATDHRPHLAFYSTQKTSANWFSEPHLFSVSHLGGDAAQYIQIDPIESARNGNVRILFDEIPFLDQHMKNGAPRFWLDIGGRWVAHDKAGNVRFVFFQRDSTSLGKPIVEYPVTIRFKWGKEEIKERFRLTWDQTRERLSVTQWG